MQNNQIKPWYKVWWIWVVIAVSFLIMSAVISSGNSESSNDSQSYSSKVSKSSKESSSYSESNSDSKDDSATSEQKNALASAETYAKDMHMSKQAVYEQLTSSYGGKFKANDAKYAMDNLKDVNWNENALKSAKTYYKDMHMSKDAVKEQLTSSYGDKFTNDEATYAVNHLN